MFVHPKCSSWSENLLLPPLRLESSTLQALTKALQLSSPSPMPKIFHHVASSQLGPLELNYFLPAAEKAHLGTANPDHLENLKL